MKLIASGVTFSAAIVRSPSFSRSSSSTTMIICPAWIASIASSILANGDLFFRVGFPIASNQQSAITIDNRQSLQSAIRNPQSAVRDRQSAFSETAKFRGTDDILPDNVAFQVDR